MKHLIIILMVVLGLALVCILFIPAQNAIMLLIAGGLLSFYALDTFVGALLLVPVLGTIVAFILDRGCGLLIIVLPIGFLLIWVLIAG